ncbi:MAG TPA: hypothetical protein VG992_00685 [Candidatus Saccharimonadales bacterium]|nr:hypothetical protein [Candidatus Saccharimonadales bacterium]
MAYEFDDRVAPLHEEPTSPEVTIELSDWETRRDNLQRALEQEAQGTSDFVRRALFIRILEEQATHPWLNTALQMYLEDNPQDTTPVSTRKIFSAFQEKVIPLPRSSRLIIPYPEHRDRKYPDGYVLPSSWDKVMGWLRDDELEQAYFQWNLNRQLKSNVVSRFAAPRVTPLLFGQTAINLYTGGPSFGMIEKVQKLYKPDKYTLPDYSVGSLEQNNKFIASEPATEQFYGLLNRRLKINRVLGADLDPPTDPLAFSYAYSNSFRPAEFRNPEYRALVRKLLMTQSETVHIFGGDFSDPRHVEHVQRNFPLWFSLPNRWVQFITSEYQTTEEQRAQTAENARALAGKDGYIMRVDFMQRTTENTLDYSVGDSGEWPPFNYNLFVTPAADRSAKPLHIFQMKDGRGTTIVPGEDLPRLEFGALGRNR